MFWGTDCQDIDDALHARVLPNGNIEAGVRACCVVSRLIRSFLTVIHRYRGRVAFCAS